MNPPLSPSCCPTLCRQQHSFRYIEASSARKKIEQSRWNPSPSPSTSRRDVTSAENPMERMIAAAASLKLPIIPHPGLRERRRSSVPFPMWAGIPDPTEDGGSQTAEIRSDLFAAVRCCILPCRQSCNRPIQSSVWSPKSHSYIFRGCPSIKVMLRP